MRSSILSMMRRLLDIESRRPASAAVVRAIVEGVVPDAATTKDRELGERMRAFVEFARHEHEGNRRLRAGDAVPAIDPHGDR